MPRSLITGVAGFMGSHLADSCLQLGHEVVGIDDLSGGFVDNVPEGVEFREASVTGHDSVRAVWEECGPFDYVYHLAAYAAEGLSHFIRRFNYTNNLIGSTNLVNQSVNSGVSRFIFASSIAVYGSAATPMVESTTPQPEDPYGIAKYAVELDLAAAQKMFGLEYTVFRPHNVYGERQNIADRYRNVIGIFMNQILRKEPMTIFGDGSQTRAFTHIADVAPLIARAPELKGSANEIFNIGADVPYSVSTLAEMVAEAMGVAPEIVHLDAREEVLHAFSDHSKCESVFGSSRCTSLEEGLSKMAAWVNNLGPRSPVQFNGEIEVETNLPPAWRQ